MARLVHRPFCVRPGCSNSFAPSLAPLGNLGNELADNRIAKGFEILCHHDEGAGSADDIGAVIMIEPAGRVGVLRIPRQRSFAQDREPIDRDSLRHGLIAQFGHIAAGIVGARHRKYRWSGGARQMARGDEADDAIYFAVLDQAGNAAEAAAAKITGFKTYADLLEALDTRRKQS